MEFLLSKLTVPLYITLKILRMNICHKYPFMILLISNIILFLQYK